jgi:hypothetical protein
VAQKFRRKPRFNFHAKIERKRGNSRGDQYDERAVFRFGRSGGNYEEITPDFFNLLPQKYFTLEGCVDNPTRSNCERARRDYVNSFLEVEDTANGYWKSGCDGGQSCLTMALFKRPNGTYIVALTVTTEMQDNNHFLEYRNGKWFDVGGQVVPNFSRKNIYELPRQGTTMQVFAKKIVDEGDGFEAAERGAKLYDLVWSGGKFSIRK